MTHNPSYPAVRMYRHLTKRRLAAENTSSGMYLRFLASFPLVSSFVVDLPTSAKGLAKNFFLQKSEITMEVGGLIQVSPGIFFLENHPKIALIFWSSIPCVLNSVYRYKHC